MGVREVGGMANFDGILNAHTHNFYDYILSLSATKLAKLAFCVPFNDAIVAIAIVSIDDSSCYQTK